MRITLAATALLIAMELSSAVGPGSLAQDEPGEPPAVQTAAQGRGAEPIYRELCALCHGDSGRGDGPLAFGMRPTVVDLRIHMADPTHTDQDLFGWINDGLPGVPLHVYRGQLTEQEVWDMIVHMRANFTEPAP